MSVDSYSFDAEQVEYEDGLCVYFHTPLSKIQEQVVELYHKIKTEETVLLVIGSYMQRTKIRSVVCSGDSEIGLNLKNYHAIERCKIVFNIPYNDCKNILC